MTDTPGRRVDTRIVADGGRRRNPAWIVAWTLWVCANTMPVKGKEPCAGQSCVVQFSQRLPRQLLRLQVTDGAWQCIAAVDGNDQITQTHITNLLESKGIECYMEGSIVYGVFVRKHHAERAERTIADDVKEGRYFILLGDGDSHKAAERATWRTGLSAAQVLAQRDFSEDTALGRLLRGKEVAPKLRELPFVESLRIRERKYLAAPDKTEIGYEVEIVLRPKANDDSSGFRGSYQVLAGGEQIQFMGSIRVQ